MPREVCALCGAREKLEPFDYHAYARRTHYGELPQGVGLGEFVKIFQGRTVYHQLVQLSVLICARCVWRMRLWRAMLWTLGIGLLIGLCILAWKGQETFMLQFEEAREAMDRLEASRPRSSLRKELQQVEADRLRTRIYDEQEGELQRAKDRALLFAIPLRVASMVAGVLALLGGLWAVWDLRWERMGQRAAVAAVRAECRKQGLKYVYPGHLAGGRPLSAPLE